MTKLPNAPLQEVIFELRWNLDVDEESNQYFDAGFDLAAGSLRSKIKNDFPVIHRKIPKDVPVQMLNYQTVFQYWSREKSWPVLQHGPGILTVNDNDLNYDWGETYLPLVKKSLIWLTESYESQLQFNSVNLRYVDSIKVDNYNFQNDWYQFLDQSLNIRIENSFETGGGATEFQINQSFKQQDGSNLVISVSNGQTIKTRDSLLYWQIGMQKTGNVSQSELIGWLESAHVKTSEIFKKIVKEELYDSFTES